MKKLFRLYRDVKGLRNGLYQKWVRRQFKAFGEHSDVIHIDNLASADCMEVGDYVRMGNHLVLEVFRGHVPSPSIKIGDNCIIGDYCHLGAINHIHIGKNVLIGRFVLIEDHNHGTALEFPDTPPIRRPLVSKGGITIGDNVWIGDKVSILSGVTIGDGAVVGANSVVTKDVPAFSTAAGVPARVIGPA